DFGFIETPYRPIVHELPKTDAAGLVNRIVSEDIKDAAGKVILAERTMIDEDGARALANAATDMIPLVPFPSAEVQYLDAHEEENWRIAQASTQTDEYGNLTANRIEVRWGDKLLLSNPVDIDYIDVSPRQIVSVAAAMIPFLEHDDANRA